jgi:alpha-galactosidase
MRRLRIVLVGGGSNAWTPNIVKDMMLTESIAGSDFVLFDINRAASDLNAAFLSRLDERLKTGARFISTDNRTKALRGADYVIITISTGGLAAMAHDIAIPERFGIYHTVGDTAGPGGWARFIRNYPVFVSLARDIRRLAPEAVVLNYTNPMTALTAVLARLLPGPVVGLCHGLFECLRFLRDYAGALREEDLAVRYAGINHFFFITEARTGRRDLLAELRRRVRTTSLTRLHRDCHPDPMGFTSRHELATELFRTTGCLPYIADRHTCEFSAGYITDRKVMRRYRLVRTSIRERRAGMDRRARRLREMLAGEIPEWYSRRSRETAADIIAAHSRGRRFVDVGNLPNTGQVSNLPRGSVVETAVRVDGRGISPIRFGALPAAAAGLVEPWCRSFDLSVEACFRGERQMGLQALRLDPSCARLTWPQIEELGGRLLAAHRKFIPEKWR